MLYTVPEFSPDVFRACYMRDSHAPTSLPLSRICAKKLHVLGGTPTLPVMTKPFACFAGTGWKAILLWAHWERSPLRQGIIVMVRFCFVGTARVT